MLGVVLWCDTQSRKAVFWCEDHRDLAYYEATTDPKCGMPEFDAGDIVRFELRDDPYLRRAYDPCVVSDKSYSELPGWLRSTASVKLTSGPRAQSARGSNAPNPRPHLRLVKASTG